VVNIYNPSYAEDGGRRISIQSLCRKPETLSEKYIKQQGYSSDGRTPASNCQKRKGRQGCGGIFLMHSPRDQIAL
jgi:hypothetical protein